MRPEPVRLRHLRSGNIKVQEPPPGKKSDSPSDSKADPKSDSKSDLSRTIRSSRRESAPLPQKHGARHATTVKPAKSSNLKSSKSSRPLSVEDIRSNNIEVNKHQLADILQRQDDHVRLLFHLEKFVSLVNYDPVVARSDHSNVFEDYQQRFDLYSKVKDAEGGGRVRSTRRQINKQKVLLEGESESVKVKSAQSSSRQREQDEPRAKKAKIEKSHHGRSKHTVRSTRSHRKVDESSEEESSLEDAQEAENLDLPPEQTFRDRFIHWETYGSSRQPNFNSHNPPVTHPSLLVPSPSYGGDLDSYLDSFKILDDDLSLDEHESFVQSQVNLRKRIENAKINGTLNILDEESDEQNTETHAMEPLREVTHHDHLVAHALVFSKLMADERKSHISRAKKLSGMIGLYFKRLSGAEERERKTEEKRMRQLARKTMAEVMKRWKLAERVIMQRRAQALEDQQRQAGKRQLSKILEHSAQLLEARVDSYPSNVSHEEEHASGSEELSEREISESEDILSEDDFMSSVDEESSENEAFFEDSKADEGLSVSELREKYAGLESMAVSGGDDEENDHSDESEQSEKEDGDEINKLTTETSPDQDSFSDSDHSTLMDSEVESDSEDQSREQSPVGLSALFSKPIPNEEASDAEFNEEIGSDVDMEDSIQDVNGNGVYENGVNENGVNENGINEINVSEETEEISERIPDEEKTPYKEIVPEPNGTQEIHNTNDKSLTANGWKHDDPLEITNETTHIDVPFLLTGNLREYQRDGLDWLVGLYNNDTNGILADEMGLGKTIQTIALISYLACVKEIWGPHLIIVPTSVMLNWEMEFKKFAPGFKVLTYYGNPAQRKEKRRGWNNEDTWHVCITSYQLVVQDHQAFRRKRWCYMILDEAHNIKNFRSQRWQALLNFNAKRRLLLTGTPLQNNLVELWSLLYFLMPSSKSNLQMPEGFANLKDFQDWFSRPVDKMIEEGQYADEDARATVSKLHQVLRPYLLRRLKADVEKQMPLKYEHVIYCKLSKRQRYLYDDFMSRAQTKETLVSGNFLSIINCLMQLRKVCNHPDLFEVRPIVTSLSLSRSVVSNVLSICDIVNRRLTQDPLKEVNLSALNLLPTANETIYTTHQQHTLGRIYGGNELVELETVRKQADKPVQVDYSSIEGHSRYNEQLQAREYFQHLSQVCYLNKLRCQPGLIYGKNVISMFQMESQNPHFPSWDYSKAALQLKVPISERELRMRDVIEKYSFVTPKVVCEDLPKLYCRTIDEHVLARFRPQETFHLPQVKLSIAFPDKTLLQYDCGKLQRLAVLLRDLVVGGHRALIFTQMTKVLDILEKFLNLHGYRYLRLDGSTKIEHRQILTERFNTDTRIPVFILSSRSGGLGINLTGADTVIFYDSDWNPSMDKQCQDRCHRIGQTRDVHIYRLVSEYTIESNILKKAQQKQILDSVVIQEGAFTTDYFSRMSVKDMIGDGLGDVPEADMVLAPKGESVESVLAKVEDVDDAAAAKTAMREVSVDKDDFNEAQQAEQGINSKTEENSPSEAGVIASDKSISTTPMVEYFEPETEVEEIEEPEIGHIDDYMISFIENGYYGD